MCTYLVKRGVFMEKQHTDSPFIADAHFDLAPDLWYRHVRGERKIMAANYLATLKKGGISLIASSLFLNDIYLPEMALRGTLDQISVLLEEIEEEKDSLALCTSPEDISKARKEGKIGILLSFEGAEPLGNDPYLLRIFHALGVRGIGLVWSRRNYVGDGCFFSPKKSGTPGGITDFGAGVLAEAERLGMFIDVSHLNDQGFWDVVELTRKPFMASHSNCRSLASSMRNLTDEQIRAIAERGGVIGLNTCSAFVAEDHQKRRLSLEELALHLDRVISLGGTDCPCFGFDICDHLPDLGFSGSLDSYDVLKDHGEVPAFLEVLRKKGYSEELIAKIAGGNYLRFLNEILM